MGKKKGGKKGGGDETTLDTPQTGGSQQQTATQPQQVIEKEQPKHEQKPGQQGKKRGGKKGGGGDEVMPDLSQAEGSQQQAQQAIEKEQQAPKHEQKPGQQGKKRRGKKGGGDEVMQPQQVPVQQQVEVKQEPIPGQQEAAVFVKQGTKKKGQKQQQGPGQQTHPQELKQQGPIQPQQIPIQQQALEKQEPTPGQQPVAFVKQDAGKKRQKQQGSGQQGPSQPIPGQQGFPQGYGQQQPPQQGPPQQGPWQKPGQQGPPQQVPLQQGPWQQPRQQGPPQQGPWQQPRQQGPWQKPGQQGPPQQEFPQQGPPQKGFPQQGPPQQGFPQQGPPQQGPPQGPWQKPGQQGIPQQEREQQGPPQQKPSQPQQGRGKQGPQQLRPGQPGYRQQTYDAPSPALSSSPQTVSRSSTPSSRQSAIEIVRDMSLLTIPNRKTTGKLGRRIPLETNHFKIDLSRLCKEALHYDVAIEPETPKRMIPMAMELFRRKHFPKRWPAFDFKKNLYSSTPLFTSSIINDKVSVVEDEGKPVEFDITIKFAAHVDLTLLQGYLGGKNKIDTVQKCIQCLDVIFRSAPALKFTRVGRSFFYPPERIIQLGNGMEMWYGFYQSAILGWKPFLNVDVAHKAFPEPIPVIDLFQDLSQCKIEQMDPRFIVSDAQRKLTDVIRGLKVMYFIPGIPSSKRQYRVNGIVGTPETLKFKLNDGRETTVLAYYKSEKNYLIKYKQLPCLHVGSQQKKNYVPIELCTIVQGQVTNRKLDEQQTRALIRKAAVPVEDRKRSIKTGLMKAKYNESNTLKDFGLSVSENFAEVDGRVLDAPKLDYDQRIIEPNLGVWRAAKFYKAVKITNWVVLNLDQRTQSQKLDMFVDLVKSETRPLGIMIDQPQPHEHMRPEIRNLTNFFEKNKTMQLIFVVIPSFGTVYSMVKSIAELNVGVLTQCIKASTMFKINNATVGNILLKVNAKLNGVNHKLHGPDRPGILIRPCMIVGADVTHPAPDQKNIPSVAAVAASHDPTASQYNFCWRLQPPAVEIIEDLENIMLEQLKVFQMRTRYKPETILFYRDGVSEGQFEQVLTNEIQAIRRACRKFADTYEPKITFLVVQKRHHTRLFPKNPRDGDRKNGNVPPGTIVDTEITHPTHLDFYLCSHASLQGVSRPTKYRLLWDDNNLTEDDIEKITYYLCHLFVRCTRTVSYPAPTYYAHLAAFRAKHYLQNDRIDLDDLNREENKRKIQSKIRELTPMFFV